MPWKWLLESETVMEPREGMVRPHQAGQDRFRVTLPEDIEWKSFAAFPPSVRMGIIVGQPSGPGPYIIRIRVPHEGG